MYWSKSLDWELRMHQRLFFIQYISQSSYLHNLCMYRNIICFDYIQEQRIKELQTELNDRAAVYKTNQFKYLYNHIKSLTSMKNKNTIQSLIYQ